MKYPKRTSEQGFSLIQMSLLLAVGGVILASMLPGGGGDLSETQRAKVTLERMEAIEAATQAFMAKNLRRPCPADGSVALTAATFGVEAATPTPVSPAVATPCTAGSPAANFSGSINIVAGMVPVKTLGLPQEYALDGYGRRIMYFVDKRAANTITTDASLVQTCQDMQNTGTRGDLEISENFTDPTVKNQTMWALVSYGKDGHGAYPANGGSRVSVTTSVDSDSVHNALDNFGNVQATAASDDSIEIIVGRRLVQKSPASGYDDFVWYKEKTKNTCAIGKFASFGQKLDGASAGTDSYSNQIAYYFGVTLAKGDLNGDGIQDLVIGQPCHGASDTTCGGTPAGRVYAVLGSKKGWPKVNDALALTSGLNGKNGFKITSTCAATMPMMGRGIGVGDVDGDGFDDIVAMSKGKIAVVFGKADFTAYSAGLDVASGLDGTTGLLLNTYGSTNAGSVAVGDFNGDGMKDFVTGDNTTSNYGFLTFGRTKARWQAGIAASTPATTACSGSAYWNLANSANFTWSSNDALRISGHTATCPATATTTTSGAITAGSGSFTVTSATGMVIGNAIFSAGTPTMGLADSSVITNIVGTTITVSPVAVSTVAAGTAITTGSSSLSIFSQLHNVAAADMNGDGIDDIIIGAPYLYKSVYVIFGRPSVTVNGTYNDGVSSYSTTMTSRLGTGTKTPPAYSHTWESTRSGTYFCVMTDNGSKSPTDTGQFTTPANHYRTVRLNLQAEYGIGAHIEVADLNNDGYPDIITSSNAKVFTFNGRSTANWTTAQITAASMTLDVNTNRPTSCITANTIPSFVNTGDINNDGLQDLLVGTPTLTNTTCGTTAGGGSIFVAYQQVAGWTGTLNMFSSNWFSSANGLPVSIDKGFRISSNTSNELIDASITGDFNGDGKTDIVVAAPGTTVSTANAGRVYILWGKDMSLWPTTRAVSVGELTF